MGKHSDASRWGDVRVLVQGLHQDPGHWLRPWRTLATWRFHRIPQWFHIFHSPKIIKIPKDRGYQGDDWDDNNFVIFCHLKFLFLAATIVAGSYGKAVLVQEGGSGNVLGLWMNLCICRTKRTSSMSWRSLTWAEWTPSRERTTRCPIWIASSSTLFELQSPSSWKLMKAQVRQCEDAINEVRVLSSLKHPYIVLEPQSLRDRSTDSSNLALTTGTCGFRILVACARCKPGVLNPNMLRPWKIMKHTMKRPWKVQHLGWGFKTIQTYSNPSWPCSAGSRSLSIRGSQCELFHRFILCELGRSTGNSSATEVVQRKLHRESELGYCDSS